MEPPTEGEDGFKNLVEQFQAEFSEQNEPNKKEGAESYDSAPFQLNQSNYLAAT